MTPTRILGSWHAYSGTASQSVQDYVDTFLFASGAPADWAQRMEDADAHMRIAEDFRQAVNLLVGCLGVTLTETQFIAEADGAYDYAHDLPELIQSIDLASIVARHDVDNEQE